MTQDTRIRYSILDPTGNITALVETPVRIADQPAAAAEIMECCGNVEQVGFVLFNPAGPDDIPVDLRMAGGEFCGNAAMSATALYAIRNKGAVDSLRIIRVHVSGSEQPVSVELQQESDCAFSTSALMPSALAVEKVEFSFGIETASLPVVRMSGITHIIIESGCPFYHLVQDRESAEKAVRDWCSALSVDCLGLMFIEPLFCGYKLTPLVFVPGCDTVFWENSCASGSSAVGMYLSSEKRSSGPVVLTEPGGNLRVESLYPEGETWLYGQVRLIGTCEIPGLSDSK